MTESLESRAETNEKLFVFCGPTEEQEKRFSDTEKTVIDTCESFAKALDSVSMWLTKELLDIFETLEGILWAKEVVAWKVVGEKTMLWGMAYKLLYEKHKDIMSEKIKDVLWNMLSNLSQYEEVKLINISIKDTLRRFASIASVQSAIDTAKFDGWRTFTPENLGGHISY